MTGGEFIMVLVLVTIIATSAGGHEHEDKESEAKAWWCFICAGVEGKTKSKAEEE